jgi:hypothetical protein
MDPDRSRSGPSGISQVGSWLFERPLSRGQNVAALPRWSDVDLFGDGGCIVELNDLSPEKAEHAMPSKPWLDSSKRSGRPARFQSIPPLQNAPIRA